jgi:hypothetical protein
MAGPRGISRRWRAREWASCWSIAAPPRAGPRHLSQFTAQPARKCSARRRPRSRGNEPCFRASCAEEQLDGSQVARLLIDLRSLRPPHRVCAVSGAVEPGTLDPGMDDPRILPGREVRLRPEPAREKVPSIPGLDLGKPGSDRGSGLLGDFELNRPARLFLNDVGAVSDPTAGADIVDLFERD